MGVLGHKLRHQRKKNPARLFPLSDDEKPIMENLFLLTDKPVIYAANISEVELFYPTSLVYFDGI